MKKMIVILVLILSTMLLSTESMDMASGDKDREKDLPIIVEHTVEMNNYV